jgi:hypothetical protein
MLACATTREVKLVDQAKEVCKLLQGPDVAKGEGEVWFWLQAKRADISRELWTPEGVHEIDSQLLKATNEVERQCLLRLREEAMAREIVRGS